MNILNSTTADIENIFHFYELAIAYQKTKFTKFWLPFDKEMVRIEVNEKRQWKIVEGDKTACIFSISYEDPFIWNKKNTDPAIYIHRIVTHPDFRGRHYVKSIIEWAKTHAKQNKKDYIRMDTWGDNESLIKYYTSCGFSFLGITVPDATDKLPKHYDSISLSLFEIKISQP